VLAATGANSEETTALAVLERVDAMDQLAVAMKDVQGLINSKDNLVAIQTEAESMRKIGESLPDLFPDGSSTGKTNAKPEIWERWAEFIAKAKNLVDGAETLRRRAAETDSSGVAEQYRALDHVCTDCHDTFRKPKR
jgi:cytochrome c556